MPRDRNKQKQIWSDEEFARKLGVIKAKRLIKGESISIAELTKEIINSPGFKQIEKELENTKKLSFGLKIKVDKRLL